MWSHALSRTSSGADTALNLAASAAFYCGYGVHAPVALNRLSFIVASAVTSGSVAAQVGFINYPTYGSTTNSVTIGLLTIPTASAVGTVIYKDVAYLQNNAGSELAIWISRQAVDSGTAAGTGFPGFTFEPAPDSVGDQSNIVASV